MQRTKAFFVTFTITFSVMLCCFMALYWIVDYSAPLPAGENQSGVPILTPDYNDTKTTLLIFDTADTDFFLLLKLNALQKKVSLVSIPSDFYLSSSGRTLSESMGYAGPMQCVQDLSRQFDITVDYHLVCDKSSLSSVLSSFSALNTNLIDNIPKSVKEYLLNGNNYIHTATLVNAVDTAASALDNPIGLEFINTAGLWLVQNNISAICDYALDSVKENTSYVTTNISTKDIDRLKRICTFLISDSTTYDRLVLQNNETAQSEIDHILKE